MKAHLQLAALAALVLGGSAEAHVGGRGGGGGRGGFSGGRVAAPNFAGGGAYRGGAGNHVGYASAGNAGNRNVGANNVGRFDGNRTNIGNNTNFGNRNTHIGNTNVGNRTNIGSNDGNRIGNVSGNRIGNNTLNGGNRIGNTTIGNNSGNRTVNNSFQGGNRSWTNNGNIVGRETNVTNVNRTANVNAAGRGGWGGWNGYHGGWGGGAGWGPGGWNRPGGWGWNRPWAGGSGWYRGGWRGWSTWPTVWGGAVGGVVAAPIVYSNPYYVPVPVPVDTSPAAPVVIQASSTYSVPPALDYSNPIQVPSQQDVDRTDTDVVKGAQAHLDAGRASFQKGDYRAALVEADKAIEILPGDANSHEFRALCLFAQKKYTDAAATIYAVLTNGPGWDYGTVSSFYADPATYKRQLRDLEAFTKANPKDAAGHFLLAYHYLVQDERPQALDQLRVVENLQPKDQLAKSIAEALAKDQKGG